MELTKHAKERLGSRGIPESEVEAVLEFGRRAPSPGHPGTVDVRFGATLVVVDPRSGRDVVVSAWVRRIGS